MAKKNYIPVFVGTTSDDETIIIYRERKNSEQLHIQRGDQVLTALGPDYEITSMVDMCSHRLHVSIKSPQWTGKASGTRRDLLEAEPI